MAAPMNSIFWRVVFGGWGGFWGELMELVMDFKGDGDCGYGDCLMKIAPQKECSCGCVLVCCVVDVLGIGVDGVRNRCI